MFRFLFLCLLTALTTPAQPPYPANLFGNPLPLPMQLAANFGELRNNHFHMGLDIRTAQRENIPVLAAADGFVSRIKVERYGYGNAIYIQHPSGHTTLYAHLNSFYPALQAAVLSHQYGSEQWAQDLIFAPGDFPVRRGQEIGLSGNTGGSAGPHLHFEIRDTKTENCLNPLLFYNLVPDAVPPTIRQVYWYNRLHTTYEQAGKPLQTGAVNPVGRRISLGLNAEDKSSNSPFYFGIYRASVWLDGVRKLEFTLNNFSYDSTRQINGCIDYGRWIRRQGGVQHVSRLPGVHLNIFSGDGSEGLLELADTQVHTIEVVAQDVAGNTSRRSFRVRYEAAMDAVPGRLSGTQLLAPNQWNYVRQGGLEADFGSSAFYDTVPLRVSAQGGSPGVQRWQLGNDQLPVNRLYTVLMPMPAGASASDRFQVGMRAGGYSQYDKGDVQPDGRLRADSLNRLGLLTVEVDNTPPLINAVGWRSGQTLKPAQVLRLHGRDSQGEIVFDRVEVDGQWQPFAHSKDDAWWRLPANLPRGEHVVKAWLSDVAGNVGMQQFTFRL